MYPSSAVGPEAGCLTCLCLGFFFFLFFFLGGGRWWGRVEPPSKVYYIVNSESSRLVSVLKGHRRGEGERTSQGTHWN